MVRKLDFSVGMDHAELTATSKRGTALPCLAQTVQQAHDSEFQNLRGRGL